MTSRTSQNIWSSYVEISRFARSLDAGVFKKGVSSRSGIQRQFPLGLVSHYSRSVPNRNNVQPEKVHYSDNESILTSFKSALKFPKSTHEIHALPDSFDPKISPEEVVLYGYLGVRSDLSKSLSFVPLTEPMHAKQIQLISTSAASEGANVDVHERLKLIKPNTPVAVRGLLKLRPQKARKGPILSEKNLEDMEIALLEVQSLNNFPSDLIMTPETEFPPEQRHLQIRNDVHLSAALRLRGLIAQFCTRRLTQSGFSEIETPLLFKSTSEGAREFIVPTRTKSLAYALPQSPQQFKQILMASGIPRYFQFARCFRDEDLRADRQPEFTQLDLEVAFANAEDVIETVEDLIRTMWQEILSIDLPKPFPRFTYEQVMSRFGSDKPDLRIPIDSFSRIDYIIPVDLVSKITSVHDPIVDAMVVPLEASTGEVRAFTSGFLDSEQNRRFLDNPDGGPGIFICDSSKPLQGLSAFGFEAAEALEERFNLEDGHLIILQARKNAPLSGGSTALGDIRNALHTAAVSQGYMKPVSWEIFTPLWVTDFPLFSPSISSEPGQGGNAGMASTHHPFTSPKTAKDVDWLMTDPTKAIGDHYDLVINGEEIGGGSRRIHHAEMQEFVMRDILKMDKDRIAEFSHLLEALRSGCPPHAGIALGFDRLVAMIHASKIKKKTSLRDVIAFPKSGKGDDPMVKSPGRMTPEVLETYHLRLRE